LVSIILSRIVLKVRQRAAGGERKLELSSEKYERIYHLHSFTCVFCIVRLV